jgi:hypothetical protein
MDRESNHPNTVHPTDTKRKAFSISSGFQPYETIYMNTSR